MTRPLPIDHPGLPECYADRAEKLSPRLPRRSRVSWGNVLALLALLGAAALLLAVLGVFGFSMGVVSGCLK